MNQLKINQDIKPLSEFRANAASIIQQVHDTKRPIVITHRGRSSAVIMDAGEYDSLLEKIELLQEIHDAEIEIKEGHGIDHDKAKKMALSRI